MRQNFPAIEINIARPIIDKFGGVVPMSKVTGLLEQTIRAWLNTGIIPERWRYGLLVIAKREGIELTPYDFVAYMVDLPIAA